MNYIQSAFNTIYGNEDDFLILGLTGRTGSGCSTVASILSSEKNKLQYDLCNEDPKNNEDRKQIIVRKFIENSDWVPFITIQVRSVITLMLAKESLSEVHKYLMLEKIIIDEGTVSSIKNLLKEVIDKSSQENKILFYSETLPNICKKIQEQLGESEFVKLYQTIGRNVRASGSPLIEDAIPGKFFTLAERIKDIVKEIRVEQRKEKQKTFIVIDALRHPLEALFFQDRFSGFFLVAVSCSDKQRKERLRKLKYTEISIIGIEKQEYNEKGVDISTKDAFFKQDIQACLQKADLYISNPDSLTKVSNLNNLTNQVLRFFALMIRPGLITPTAMERCMQIAHTAKLNSGCISRQVGAVVTDKNFSVQSVGWNDTPFGQIPCILRSRDNLLKGKDLDAYSDFEKNDDEYLNHFEERTKKFISISSERNISYCFKSEYNKLKKDSNQVHTRSLHAEENAFLQITKYGGRGIEGGNLFTTASPCELCSKKAYQLGIKNIYYIDPYPGIATNHILQGGTNNPELIIFNGAVGKAFHKLYTPVVAYKDELTALANE